MLLPSNPNRRRRRAGGDVLMFHFAGWIKVERDTVFVDYLTHAANSDKDYLFRGSTFTIVASSSSSSEFNSDNTFRKSVDAFFLRN